MAGWLVLGLVAAALPGAEDYLAGRAAERTVHYRDATAAYRACAAKAGPLAPYAEVRTAYCRSRAGDPGEAAKAYRRVVDGQPGGPWTLMAQTYLARLNAQQDNHAQAVVLFSPFMAVEPRLWWFDDHLWPAAESCLAQPATREQGYAFFRDVVAHTRLQAPRAEAAKRLATSPRIEDRLAAAYGLVRSGPRNEAGKGLLKLAADMLDEKVAETQLDAYVLG